MPDPNQTPFYDPNVPPPAPSQNVPSNVNPVTSTPSYGLTQEQSPFAPFPKVETQTPNDSVLIPTLNTMPVSSAPNPGLAMTVSPDNSGSKFTMFIVVLGAIVALIFSGVVFLYFSNTKLNESLSTTVDSSALN